MSVNFEMFFWVVDFLQKTNENKFTWGLIVVKLNSFVCFLEEIDDPKKHFEIKWPLVWNAVNKLKKKQFYEQSKSKKQWVEDV